MNESYIVAITVQRNNIIVGAISGFEIGRVGEAPNRGIGGTTGECTIRREIEYFDVDIEQAFGTLRKSPVSDKRFLSVSTAEASLQRLLEAWNDDQSISAGIVDGDFDVVQASKSVAGAFPTTMGTSSGETAPRGLTHDGTQFYMIGGTESSLYVMNALGQVRKIQAGNITNYGQADQTFWGLASIGSVVYGIARGSTGNGSLYTFDTTTGAATLVGELGDEASFAVYGLAASDADAAAPNVLYALLADTAVGFSLCTVDRTTGTATNVGDVSLEGPGGLAWGNGGLYAMLEHGGNGWGLYQLDTSDGSATQVGNADNFGLPASAGTVVPRGLTFFDGDFWAAIDSAGSLMRINPDSGVGRLAGDIDTMYMNNMPTGGNIDNLEKQIKIIVPGANNRFRAYKFYTCVSTAPAEHMYQKNGLTMVPYEFEVLVDPNRSDGQYGIIKDFPTEMLAEAF